MATNNPKGGGGGDGEGIEGRGKRGGDGEEGHDSKNPPTEPMHGWYDTTKGEVGPILERPTYPFHSLPGGGGGETMGTKHSPLPPPHHQFTLRKCVILRKLHS